VARWVKARTSAERGNLEELYEALGTGKLPGPRATADLLDAMGRQLESPDPRMVDLVRIARRHFDSRPASRLVWAEVLRIHERDLERSAALVGSMVDAGAGAYPLDEVVLARQRGRIDRLDQIAGDERLPFPARLEAAGALADRGAKAQAEKALRRLARERPRDVATHERLIRFLNDGGRPDALAAAVELVRAFGEDDSFDVARARCAAARQLDGMGRHEEALAMVERALPTEAACAYRIATVQLAHLGKKDDAEGLLLADLARHPLASTAVTMAEVRWRSHNDAGAADIVAHPPAPLERGDFRELAQRFADVFRNRPPGDVKHAAETLLQAGIHPQPLLALGPPLARTGAHAQAFELYAVLIPKLPAEKIAWAQLHAWSALRAAKGAPAAEAWLRKQAGPEATPVSDDDLAMVAYGDGLDEALWDLFPAKPLDAAFADRLALLRAASLVRHGERSARRDALVAELSDPLSRWKAHLARSLGLAGAYASWEVRLARFVLGEGSEEEIADDATEGSRPCEAPYYFGVRAASESRAPEAAAWYRVALECRNPDQAEFAWAYRAASQIGQEQAPPANLPQAAR
jgi:hypothetical protein